MIIKAILLIAATIAVITIAHDDRIKEPYTSILGISVYVLLGYLLWKLGLK